MSRRIVILASAERDLRDLRTYLIETLSAEVRRRAYTGLRESIGNLQAFPLAGTIPAELEKLHISQYRQVVSGRNRIIYEVKQDVIYIHVVADTRRDMHALLTSRLLRGT